MTRSLNFLGIGAFVLAAAVIVIGVSAIAHDAMAQNVTPPSTGGDRAYQNATGASSSPQAMNNTLNPVGPANETVITK